MVLLITDVSNYRFKDLRHLGFIATTIIMVNSTHGMLTDFNNDECA